MSQPGWGAPPQQQWPGQQQYPAQQQGFGGGGQQAPWGQPPQQGNPWGPPPQQQPAQRDTRSANDILMGGGGAPAWAFEAPGVRKVARITKPPQSKQEREYDPRNPGGGKPKFFPSGDPIMGVTVEVQTNERDPQDPDDDGKRTFYIEGKRLKEAVREAVRAAGANGLEVGGTLDVTLTHYDEPNDRKSGRNWQISYTLPGNNVLMDQPQQGGFQQAPPPATLPPQYQPAQPPHQYPGGPFQDQGQPTTPPPPQQQGMSPEQQAAYDAWGQGGPSGPPSYDEPPF